MQVGVGHRPRSPAVRLLLDTDAWLVLHETLPGVPLPVWMRPRWSQAVGRGQRESLRAAAIRRLVRLGVLTTTPVPGPDGVRAVHPPLLQGLMVLGSADLTVTVRSWIGDRAVLAYFAVAGDRGSSVIRAQLVAEGPQGYPQVVGDQAGIELSGFLPEDLLDESMRVVPGSVDTPSPGSRPDPLGAGRWEDGTLRHHHDAPYPGPPGGGTPDPSLRLEWEESQRLAAALHEGRDDLMAGLLEGLASTAGPPPPSLGSLAQRLRGAVEITVASSGPGTVARHGLWLLTRSGTVAVMGSHQYGQGPRVHLELVTPGSVRADVLSAVVTIWGAEARV